MRPSEALQRVARLFTIITLVRSSERPLGRPHLAQACGCDPRTIQRDLQLLQEAGIPVDYDPGRRGYVLPEKGWVFPLAAMTAEDALALALMRGIIGIAGLPQAEALRATLDKLTASLSPALGDLMQDAAKALQSGRLGRDYSQAPLTRLLTAIGARQTVEIDYRSRSGGERSWRRVDPYNVAMRDGQFWELHGWCHRRHEVRTFALDQVLGMRETVETFQMRASAWEAFISVRGVIGGIRKDAVVTVEVVFLAEVAAYAADRQWPAGLRLEKHMDGTARLTGAAQGVDGLVAELLRWRRLCVVEGGPELRARMAEEIKAMAALYE